MQTDNFLTEVRDFLKKKQEEEMNNSFLNKIKKHIVLIISTVIVLIFFIVWAFFTHTEVVDPGYELVINDKPYFFGHEGVRKEPIKEGRILLFNTSSATPVNMMPQSKPMPVDDFSSKDNTLLDFETTIQYRYTSSVELVSKFGNDWFKNNLSQQYLSIVRYAVKQRTMTQMMSDPEIGVQIDDYITGELQKLVKDSGLPIQILGVSLGSAKPNPEVLQKMNETASQEQQEKVMAAAERAQLARKREQIAKAAADNAYRENMNFTTEQFIALEQAKLYSAACSEKGNTCIISSGQHPIVVGK